jgi:hypothetical protein
MTAFIGLRTSASARLRWRRPKTAVEPPCISIVQSGASQSIAEITGEGTHRRRVLLVIALTFS